MLEGEECEAVKREVSGRYWIFRPKADPPSRLRRDKLAENQRSPVSTKWTL